jgi:hypothetical protein
MATQSFDTRVSNVVKSLSKQRDNIQALIVEAFEYYVSTEDNNALYLTKLYNALVDNKVTNATKVKGYILACSSSLNYGKNKEGVNIFRHTKGSDKDVLIPALSWYEWAKAPKSNDNKPELTKAEKAEKAVHSLVNRMAKEGVTVSDLIEQLQALQVLK